MAGSSHVRYNQWLVVLFLAGELQTGVWSEGEVANTAACDQSDRGDTKAAIRLTDDDSREETAVVGHGNEHEDVSNGELDHHQERVEHAQLEDQATARVRRER